MKKGLLISGYQSLSQASWCDFLTEQLLDINWSTIALPARYFSWRMRGNPLSIGQLSPDVIIKNYDFILATSSVDLATVQSIYPQLRNIPSILYFHDNQFAYPAANNPQSVVDWQITAIYSALRADRLVFNSQFNQDTFMQGVHNLLKKMPDLAPKNLALTLNKKATVLPVPIKNHPQILNIHKTNKLRIIWNHRWEWDKNPALLEKIVDKLSAHSSNIELIITGQQFRSVPENFQRIQSQKNVVNHCNFIADAQEYQNILASCDIVLSTAIHEFQGIAVLEAVAAGCVPLLPNRLSYPEIFEKKYLYQGTGSLEEQAICATDLILDWLANGLPTVPEVSAYYESTLVPAYQKLLAEFNQ